jgi:acyl-CoA dehydrogenase family protein 9
MRSLFAGVIDDEILFPYPRVDPAEREVVDDFLARLRPFCESNLDPASIDEHEHIPPGALEGLKEMGLFGISIPREYGGMGLSQSAYCRIFEWITSFDVGLGILLGVHLSIGVKGIQLAGTEAQKRFYLPRAASGEWLASFALTESEAGSDAAGIRSRAVPDGEGGWVLNGSKIWIGNASFSEIIVVFAQTPVERDGDQVDRVSAFVLHPDMPGLERGDELRKMGARGSNQAELHFHDVRIPAANLLGDVGGGFKLAMRVLNSGRQGLSAGAAGGVKRCLRLATEWATEREQFGQPIARYDLIAGKLAALAADALTADSVAYFTTGLADRGDIDYALESAAGKVWNSDALDRSVDELVQIAGGRGYVKPFPYERLYRDARITRIFEGTNEILRLFVGLSGIEEPAERLRALGAALRAPIRQFGLLRDFSGEQVRLALHRGEPEVEGDVDPRLRIHFDYLVDHTRDLRVATDRAIRRHRAGIVDQQFTVARLADMAIELYVRAAVLSRVQSALAADSTHLPGGAADVAALLRLCDLACQRSGLRFRSARVALNGERDDLVRSVRDDLVAAEKHPSDPIGGG